MVSTASHYMKEAVYYLVLFIVAFDNCFFPRSNIPRTFLLIWLLQLPRSRSSNFPSYFFHIFESAHKVRVFIAIHQWGLMDYSLIFNYAPAQLKPTEAYFLTFQRLSQALFLLGSIVFLFSFFIQLIIHHFIMAFFHKIAFLCVGTMQDKIFFFKTHFKKTFVYIFNFKFVFSLGF